MGGKSCCIEGASLYGDPRYNGPFLEGWEHIGNASITYTQMDAAKLYAKYFPDTELTARAFEVSGYWMWAIYRRAKW